MQSASYVVFKMLDMFIDDFLNNFKIRKYKTVINVLKVKMSFYTTKKPHISCKFCFKKFFVGNTRGGNAGRPSPFRLGPHKARTT